MEKEDEPEEGGEDDETRGGVAATSVRVSERVFLVLPQYNS